MYVHLTLKLQISTEIFFHKLNVKPDKVQITRKTTIHFIEFYYANLLLCVNHTLDLVEA
jgi:hypothetical protein